MSSFLDAVKSETTKLATVKSTWTYFILLGGAIGGPVFLTMMFSKDLSSLTLGDLMIGGMIAQMIAVIFGASTTAGEIGTKMHAQAFLTQRSRWNWLGARAVVVTAFVLITMLIAAALTALMVTVWPNVKLETTEQSILWLYILSNPAFALLAVGVAGVLRSRVAAVGIPLVWMMVAEPLLISAGGRTKLVEEMAKFLPGRTVNDLEKWIMIPEHAADMLTPGFSIAVLAGWIIAMLAFGFWRNARTDVR